MFILNKFMRGREFNLNIDFFALLVFVNVIVGMVYEQHAVTEN